jgi:hypothetical protein
MAKEITVEGEIDSESGVGTNPQATQPLGQASGIGDIREPRGTDVDNTNPEGMGEPQVEQKAVVDVARQTELKQWKAVALRMVDKGKSPLDYQFDTIAIEPGEAAFIRQMFAFGATTKHAIKSVFTDIDYYHKASLESVLGGEFALDETESKRYYAEIDALTVDYQASSIDRQSFIERLVAAAKLAIIGTYLTRLNLETYDDLPQPVKDRITEQVKIHQHSAEMLADDIDAGVYNPDVNENADTSKKSRLLLWLLALAAVASAAELDALDDDEYVGWRFGPTDHCEDCARLDGQVHTKSEWAESGWYPRAFHLACHGYWCQCRWVFDATGPSVGDF